MIKTPRNLVITSVAFQDHITRSFLRDGCSRPPGPSGGSGPGHGPARTCRTSRTSKEEDVIAQTPTRWTLAQTLGLVAPPPRRLTEDEWRKVKRRAEQRGDSALPCAICWQEFRLKPQVLLCCSHVFHRVCVRAFERFSGRKCCPVCRKSEYDTRVIQDGARLFREQSATRIQACWRGFAARRSYRILRRSFPPKDKCLRRKFFEEKLQRLSDSLVRRCHGDVEAFLGDVDRSLAASRRLFQRLEGEERRGEGPGEGEWRRIQTQVLQRDGWDCSICLAPVCGPHARPRPPAPRRPALLLSCSHLFHRRCLEAFEAFQASGAGRAPRCPLCRSEYHKKVLALED